MFMSLLLGKAKDTKKQREGTAKKTPAGVEEWDEWNATMLPEVKESYTHSFDGEELADHFGAKQSDGTPDNPGPPDE
jgi:hypothetical protein